AEHQAVSGARDDERAGTGAIVLDGDVGGGIEGVAVNVLGALEVVETRAGIHVRVAAGADESVAGAGCARDKAFVASAGVGQDRLETGQSDELASVAVCVELLHGAAAVADGDRLGGLVDQAVQASVRVVRKDSCSARTLRFDDYL